MYFPCFIHVYTIRVDVTISSLDQTTVKYQEVVRRYIVYLTEYGDKSAREREREERGGEREGERERFPRFLPKFETWTIVIIGALQLILLITNDI